VISFPSAVRLQTRKVDVTNPSAMTLSSGGFFTPKSLRKLDPPSQDFPRGVRSFSSECRFSTRDSGSIKE
jgi:hypothetical protein